MSSEFLLLWNRKKSHILPISMVILWLLSQLIYGKGRRKRKFLRKFVTFDFSFSLFFLSISFSLALSPHRISQDSFNMACFYAINFAESKRNTATRTYPQFCYFGMRPTAWRQQISNGELKLIPSVEAVSRQRYTTNSRNNVRKASFPITLRRWINCNKKHTSSSRGWNGARRIQ